MFALLVEWRHGPVAPVMAIPFDLALVLHMFATQLHSGLLGDLAQSDKGNATRFVRRKKQAGIEDLPNTYIWYLKSPESETTLTSTPGSVPNFTAEDMHNDSSVSFSTFYV